MQKALLYAMLMPNEHMAKLQDSKNFTQLMVMNETLKEYPFGDVWDAFCDMEHVPLKQDWLADVKEYENKVLSKRN
jgi:L-rhamnose isomerase